MQAIERKPGNYNSPVCFIIMTAQNDTRYKESGRVTNDKKWRTEKRFFWSASTTKNTESHCNQYLYNIRKTDGLCYFWHITIKTRTCTKVVTCSAKLEAFQTCRFMLSYDLFCHCFITATTNKSNYISSRLCMENQLNIHSPLVVGRCLSVYNECIFCCILLRPVDKLTKCTACYGRLAFFDVWNVAFTREEKAKESFRAGGHWNMVWLMCW